MSSASKRPDNPKFNVVKPPPELIFVKSLQTDQSVYVTKLREAISSDSVLEILSTDKYLLTQIRTAAKKLEGIRLVYAARGDRLYIKPVITSGEETRLHTLLRYPRTMNELLAAKFQLNVVTTMSSMVKEGTVHELKGKYVLTEKGFDLLGEKPEKHGVIRAAAGE